MAQGTRFVCLFPPVCEETIHCNIRSRDVERQLGIAQQRGISPGDMTELVRTHRFVCDSIFCSHFVEWCLLYLKVMKYCKLVVQKFETVCCPLDPEFSLMATDHHSQERLMCAYANMCRHR